MFAKLNNEKFKMFTKNTTLTSEFELLSLTATEPLKINVFKQIIVLALKNSHSSSSPEQPEQYDMFRPY